MLLTLALSGCGAHAAARPTALPSPVPSATADVGFVVDTTSLPALRPTPHPSPAPTRFVPPAGPYIVLSRDSGPPRQRAVAVTGAHLPPSSQVSLEWTAGSRAPITTVAWTDAKGRLATRFTVPASPPGLYRIRAVINGSLYASAPYRILSRATLTVSVGPTGSGDALRVRGTGFLPHVHLLLITYPLDLPRRPFVLAQAYSSAHGTFLVIRVVRRLPLGQYALRAYTVSGVAAQMAEGYFEVVI